MGKWVADDCYPANDAKIWQVLLYLLQDRSQGSDEVVRLTAAMALRECVDVRIRAVLASVWLLTKARHCRSISTSSRRTCLRL